MHQIELRQMSGFSLSKFQSDPHTKPLYSCKKKKKLYSILWTTFMLLFVIFELDSPISFSLWDILQKLQSYSFLKKFLKKAETQKDKKNDMMPYKIHR